MTQITIQDGAIVVRGGKIGTQQACCCGDVCEACIDISKVVAVAVKSGCDPTDAQACTITIPDEYSLPVTVRISGGVDDDVKFNGSIIEPAEYIYADNCNGAHLIGTADSGPGYVDEEVNARTFTLTLVDNFGVVSVMNIKVCIDPENTQEVCIPPTTDCPVPPPPMVQCCQRVQECDSTTISKCVNVRSDVCCKSYSYGTETDCEGSTPPYTSCEAGDASPSNTPPYDCVNGDFAFGAWVTVDDWTTFDPDETDPDLIALYAEADSKVNQSFFVPFTCLGSATETIDLGVGAGADRTTAGTRCDDANWFAEVSVNLCARTASVAVSNDSCWSATDIQINLSDLTAITVPCNEWTGCNCAAFSGANEGFGGGTVSVDSLEP